MNPAEVPPLPPGSPWAGWAPPNLKWCEENLAGWITAPANTWSNVAYFIAAAIIWRFSRAAAPELRFFAPAVLVMGAGSFLYHASYTFAFQIADFFGMYVVLFQFVVLNMRRAGMASPATQVRWYLLGVGFFTALMLAMAKLRLPYQSLILVIAALLAAQEWQLARRARGVDYRDLKRAWGLLAVAFTCSALDLTRCWCNPQDHVFQGHAAWHVCSAIGITFACRFYAQPGLLAEPSVTAS